MHITSPRAHRPYGTDHNDDAEALQLDDLRDPFPFFFQPTTESSQVRKGNGDKCSNPIDVPPAVKVGVSGYSLLDQKSATLIDETTDGMVGC